MIYNMVELIVIAVSYNMITYEYSMKGDTQKGNASLSYRLVGWGVEDDQAGSVPISSLDNAWNEDRMVTFMI